MATSAPSRANSTATARPMPESPPVTIAAHPRACRCRGSRAPGSAARAAARARGRACPGAAPAACSGCRRAPACTAALPLLACLACAAARVARILLALDAARGGAGRRRAFRRSRPGVAHGWLTRTRRTALGSVDGGRRQALCPALTSTAPPRSPTCRRRRLAGRPDHGGDHHLQVRGVDRLVDMRLEAGGEGALHVLRCGRARSGRSPAGSPSAAGLRSSSIS